MSPRSALPLRGARLAAVVLVALVALVSSFAVVAAFSARARAATWSETFTPDALNAVTLPGRTRVTVVAGGPASPSLEAARAALVAGLRGAARGWLVVDGDVLREIDPDADDAALVSDERDARELDAIWVVRIADPAGTSAVVAIYSTLGARLKVVEAKLGVPLRLVAAPDDRALEYLRQRISPLGGDGVAPAGRETYTRAGFAKDGIALRDARSLYFALGRYDLVRRYDAAASDQFLAQVIAGGVALVGVVVVMHDVFSQGGVPRASLGVGGVVGLCAVGLGVGGVVIATTLDPDPLDFDGKVRAIHDYNSELATRLQTARGPAVHLTGLGLAPLRDGLALGLSASF